MCAALIIEIANKALLGLVPVRDDSVLFRNTATDQSKGWSK
jgi:hypothetical protein